MIVDFLKSLQEAYTLSFDGKEQELRSINTEIAETNKFLALLQSESEGSFTQFTPRNVTNKNSKKIDELNGKLVLLNEKREALEKERDDILTWLRDIDECLEEVNVSTTKIPTKDVVINKEQISSVTIGSKNESVSSSEITASSRDDVPLFSKEDIVRIADYLPADPMRARVELLNLAKKFD